MSVPSSAEPQEDSEDEDGEATSVPPPSKGSSGSRSSRGLPLPPAVALTQPRSNRTRSVSPSCSAPSETMISPALSLQTFADFLETALRTTPAERAR